MSDLFGAGFTWNDAESDTVELDNVDFDKLSPAAATLPATAQMAETRRVEAPAPAAVAAVANVAPWRAGIESLRVGSAPEDASMRGWDRMVRDAFVLADLWAEELFSLGWSEIDVFGTNRNQRARRLDCVGLVHLLDGRPVLSVTATHASIKAAARDVTRFDRRLIARGGVPIWAVEREGVEVLLGATGLGEGPGVARQALTPVRPILSTGPRNTGEGKN